MISVTDHLSPDIDLLLRGQASELVWINKYVTVCASNLRQLRETLKLLPFTLNTFHLDHINFFGQMNVLRNYKRLRWTCIKTLFFSHDYLSVTEWRSPSINKFLVCSSTVVVNGSIYRRWWQHYLAVLIRASLEAGTTLACGTSVTINQSTVGWPEAMSGLRQWTHRHTKPYQPAPCLLNPTAPGHDIR